MEDCGQLLVVRDHLVDWVILESSLSPNDEFPEQLTDLLERLRELACRPPEVNEWNDVWFEAHGLFVYETFLYIVAALVRNSSFATLQHIFSNHYLKPKAVRYNDSTFELFDSFMAQSRTLNEVLAPPGKRILSPAAALLRQQATRSDLPFAAVMEADLLTFLVALIGDGTRWYPQLLVYAEFNEEFPLFIRAAKRKDFGKLSAITGEPDADNLRKRVASGYTRVGVAGWNLFHFPENLLSLMRIDKWATLG